MQRLSPRVMDINRRRRIPARAIEFVVGEIVRLFSPEKIILFGSYARGEPRPESDLDLLVIMHTRRQQQQSLVIRRAVSHNFAWDLIVYTPFTFRRRVNLGDCFLREIENEGRVLYERPDN